MKYTVLIEWSEPHRKWRWTVHLPDKPAVRTFPEIPNAEGFESRLSKARSGVSVALQQLKAEHEEDLRNAGKRIEFEGEL